jgi:hypothetical protein
MGREGLRYVLPFASHLHAPCAGIELVECRMDVCAISAVKIRRRCGSMRTNANESPRANGLYAEDH